MLEVVQTLRNRFPLGVVVKNPVESLVLAARATDIGGRDNLCCCPVPRLEDSQRTWQPSV